MGEGGLKRWFEEKWVDIKTGKPCGRQKGEKRAYPACRPSKRVSDKTPKTVGEMTKSEKDRFKREKTSSKKISYQHKRKKSPMKTKTKSPIKTKTKTKSPIKIKGKVFNPYSGRYVNKDGVTAKKYNLTMSAGEKDACYYKVKSRVKVWPSAYASGQLTQCRERGANNWGTGKN